MLKLTSLNLTGCRFYLPLKQQHTPCLNIQRIGSTPGISIVLWNRNELMDYQPQTGFRYLRAFQLFDDFLTDMYQKESVRMTQSVSKTRGWVVTFAGTGINLALGVLYTWSVIKAAIPAEWGWTAAQKSDPYALACFVFAIAMIPAGRLQDKIGPRWVATIGGAAVALGFGLQQCGYGPLENPEGHRDVRRSRAGQPPDRSGPRHDQRGNRVRGGEDHRCCP